MLEIIEFYKSSRYAVVVWLLLLSAISGRAQEQGSAYTLTAGQPAVREMKGGEEHQYQVRLNAGQHVRVVVEQKGIDVVLVLSGADGKPVLEVDNNLSGTRGLEVLSVIACLLYTSDAADE